MTRVRLAVLITACVALLAACTTGDDSPASLPTPEPANVSSPMNEGGESTVGAPESAGTDAQDPADADDLDAAPAPRAEPINESDAPAVDAPAPQGANVARIEFRPRPPRAAQAIAQRTPATSPPGLPRLRSIHRRSFGDI